jgi:hypothetical protein
MRYAVLFLSLMLMGAGCVESLVESQADVLVDMALDGAEVLKSRKDSSLESSAQTVLEKAPS